MKIQCWILMMLLLLPVWCLGETGKPGRIILLTDYRQQGWGDQVQIGCMDEDGCLFTLEGSDAQLHWPSEENQKRIYLEQSEDLCYLGRLDAENRFAIESLISDAANLAEKAVSSGGCDMGTESTCAFRYSREGTPETVPLGISGDDFFENTDPSAQALYRWARRLFPKIQSYAYGMEGIGPQGFVPQPLAAFLNIPLTEVDQARIRCLYMDCEAGPQPVELTVEEETAIRELLKSGMVTGKANSISVTGGTRSYSVSDSEGNLLGWMELYGELLVRGNGMYTLGPDGSSAGDFQVLSD